MNAESNIDDLGAEPSFSLTLALRDVARRGGQAIDVDDLHAALGLSFMLCASHEEDLSAWPTLARDAFLVEAGRLFGMGIREVHPPEAARGLDRAEEFQQHFDASYRPLIERALENGQPVLAWRGWAGEWTGLWGIVTDTSDGGIGFSGRVFGAGGDGHTGRAAPLSRPPVQLYVVETLSREKVLSAELLYAVVEHAAVLLCNGLSDRFAVMTGPGAYELWAARLAATEHGEPDARQRLAYHQRLATSVAATHRSGLRFLGNALDRCSADKRTVVACLQAGCESVFNAMAESGSQVHAESRGPGGDWPAGFLAAIDRARQATEGMLSGLKGSLDAAL